MIRTLGEGLVLRRATAADTEALAAFNADVLRHQDAAEPDARTAAWTRDLLSGRHPAVGPDDFTVVEDPRRRCIVSSLVLISQTWSYGGIHLKVGQPELIGTHPDYRGRGLVREQLDVAHRWSTARGHQLLAIDGIPWFYRQFGYEMALALRGEISIDAQRIHPADPRVTPPYQVRPAHADDIPFIADTAERAGSRSLVASYRDEALWHYELSGRSTTNLYRVVLSVIQTAEARRAGFVVHAPRLSGGSMIVLGYELGDAADWDAVTPVVLQHLRAAGAAVSGSDQQPRRIGFQLGTDHPAYTRLTALAPRDEGAYAWYLRVPNLPDFLRCIGSLLEHRLEQSPLAGYSGRLRIGFYRSGVHLRFADGRLLDVTPWQPPLGLTGIEKNEPSVAERADASIPGLTFLQLLFGYRSLRDLQYAFPDCLARTDEARTLIEILFPKLASNVWAVL